MKITRVAVYQTVLPYSKGVYVWGAGNELRDSKTSVVVLETDAGLSGCGEFAPCGENYMHAHSQGVEAVARLVAPALLGEDPRQVGRIERLMDNIVQGHGYAKAPFDAACWDILGQSLEQPVWMLLGGRMMDSAPLYRVAPQKPVNESLEEMRSYRAEGYRQFQIKVGMNWSADIERIESSVGMLEAGETAMADANQGWRVDEALRVAKATRSLDYFLEQPCKTYEECLQLRRRIDLPIKLDECVTGMAMAQRIVADRGAEIVSLKVSNIGGLSKTRRVRDFFVDNRIPVVVEDSWGGEIASSVFAHLAVSTPADFFVNTTDLMNYNTRSTGIGGAVTKDGRFYAPDVPGLGVRADFESLGAPVAEYA